MVDVDFEQMKRAVQNLLENALLHGGDDGDVTVGARGWNEGVRLWIEDQGPGVPPDEHEAVFEKFYRGRPSGERVVSGTGLGLAIAREIVHAHRGAISIEDVKPHGARFVIVLPVGPPHRHPIRRGGVMTIPERPTRILVVDDEEQIRRALKSILSTRGYTLDMAVNAQEALIKAIDSPPDLVVLDLMLPDRSGIEVCRELRTWMTAPILILSVRAGEAEKIQALDEGADDYLTKPFSAGELLARVRALLRRAAALTSPPPVVTTGDLEVDIARRRVRLAGADVALTPTEFDILAFLARNAGLVVSQRMILEHVWGPEWVEDAQTLRVHVSNLRKKIEPRSGGPRFIITEPGVGFRFASADEAG